MIVRCPRILGTGLDDVVDGWVRIGGDRIVEVGRGDPPAGEAVEHPGWLAPGYVDLHVHGGGGAAFQSGEPADVETAVGFHRRHGTTTMLASLVSADVADLAAVTRRLATAVARGLIAGVHLEGPFLAPGRRGAHDVSVLRPPDPSDVRRLLDAGPVRVVTLAPELPGALDAIRTITGAGVVAAVGHTDAAYEEVVAAIDAGARLGTHLFNGMGPVHHRAPGPVVALLEDPRVVVELIADGVHVHTALVAGLLRSAASRVALVTDAVAATGLPDGRFRLGSQYVVVRDGVSRLVVGDSLAGSTLTMERAVAGAVRAGAEPAVAVAAATATPARVLGLQDEVGSVAPGLRADLVALDDDFAVTEVWRAGERVS